MIRMANKEDLAKLGGVRSLAALRPVLSKHITNEAAMAANATLRKYEWESIDQRVNDVMRERLTIVDDLRGLGLVHPLSLGSVLRTTERLEDWSAAEVSFDGDTAPKKDRPSYLAESIPVPVVSKDFSISWRQLEASRIRGEPLDLTAAASATRRVRDQLQALFANGFTGGPGLGATSIPGLTTAASRLIVTLATPWNNSGATIIADVERMIKTAYAANLFGPFYLYVPKNVWAVLQADYILAANISTKTYMDRIMDFVDIKAVRPLDSLADDNMVLVQMTEDVIDMSEAQAVTTIQWQKNPLVTEFRVLAVAGPHIKKIESAADGGTGGTIHGIVHLH